MSINQTDWILDIEGMTAAKLVPGVIALVLLLEGIRKLAGSLLNDGLAGTLMPFSVLLIALGTAWILYDMVRREAGPGSGSSKDQSGMAESSRRCCLSHSRMYWCSSTSRKANSGLSAAASRRKRPRSRSPLS